MLPEFDEETLRPIIPKDQLQDGAYYLGRCRNATIARWDASMGCFIHWREKFGRIFIEEISHPVDDDDFDVFRVYKLLTDPKFAIPFCRTANFEGRVEDLREYDNLMWGKP